jgi:hypothetical protein
MELPLTQGKVAHIDPEDWPLVSQYKWHAAKMEDGKWYVLTSIPTGKKNPRQKKVRLHTLLMGA